MGFPEGPLAGAPLNIPQDPEGAVAFAPVFEEDNPAPDLTYKIEPKSDQSIAILGNNFDLVSPFTVSLVDVRVPGGGNVGPPPVVDSVSNDNVKVDIAFDGADSRNGDVWAILLTDTNGEPHTPPSPLFVVQGA